MDIDSHSMIDFSVSLNWNMYKQNWDITLDGKTFTQTTFFYRLSGAKISRRQEHFGLMGGNFKIQSEWRHKDKRIYEDSLGRPASFGSILLYVNK